MEISEDQRKQAIVNARRAKHGKIKRKKKQVLIPFKLLFIYFQFNILLVLKCDF